MGLGLAVGAVLTLAFRRGPRGRRPAAALARAAGRGAVSAGRLGAAGARRAAHRGEELLGQLPVDDIRESIGDYLSAAREAIDDAVAHEVKDLRKAVRRQRKRLGI